MKRFVHACIGGVLLPALWSGTVAAEQIYRSVDAEGNVTFSNQPSANAVSVDEVSVQPGPSVAQQREAQERLQRQEATAQSLGEARASRARQQEQAHSPTPETVEPEEPVNQYYGDPYANTRLRDKIRDRVPPRPVQLPARPTPR
jgi:hypothetical protein